jgi:hypothetical protein
MSRKIKPIKLTWKYIGDESPQKKKESEERLEQAYDILFKEALLQINKRKSPPR